MIPDNPYHRGYEKTLSEIWERAATTQDPCPPYTSVDALIAWSRGRAYQWRPEHDLADRV